MNDSSGRGAKVLREEGDTSFGGETRHRLVEDFAVGFYNGTLKPNLAEKNPMNGREIEYLMDGPQFEKIKRADLWSYSSAVGSGYEFRVVYRDKRFSELERTVRIYSGAEPLPDVDRDLVERRLYEIILVLIREGRLPKTFRIQSSRDLDQEKVTRMLEEFGRSLDDLARRVRKMEDELALQNVPKPTAEAGGAS